MCKTTYNLDKQENVLCTYLFRVAAHTSNELQDKYILRNVGSDILICRSASRHNTNSNSSIKRQKLSIVGTNLASMPNQTFLQVWLGRKGCQDLEKSQNPNERRDQKVFGRLAICQSSTSLARLSLPPKGSPEFRTTLYLPPLPCFLFICSLTSFNKYMEKGK